MKPEKVQNTNGVNGDQNVPCERFCQGLPNVGSSVSDKMRCRRYIVNFLVLMFGIGACIGVNGLSAEAPLLVISAPEGSALPSNMALATVASYVAPALYALYNRSSSLLKVSTEFTWISAALVLGTIAMALLAFFHNVTTTFNAANHSIPLLILCFISGSVSGFRNILLMPYLRHFEEAHLVSFFIGEGLSGFVPSIVALIQGVGGDPICSNNTTNSTEQPMPYIRPPSFSPRDYFLFLFILMVSSTCAFWALEYLRIQTSRKMKAVKFVYDCVTTDERNSCGTLLDQKFAEKNCENKTTHVADPKPTHPTSYTPGKRVTNTIYLCVLMWLVCSIANGYLFAIETFSARPYGNVAYHLVVNLSQLASTLACVLTFWLPRVGTQGITRIMSIVCVSSAYVTWLALRSPMPPWRDTTHGVVLLVMIWMILMCLISYVKFAITEIIWQESSDAGLYYLGFAILLGSMCGVTNAFYLINYTALFTPYTPCEHHA